LGYYFGLVNRIMKIMERQMAISHVQSSTKRNQQTYTK